MINASEHAKHTMSKYLNYVASDHRRLNSKESVEKINENMRLAQIEMINGYLDDMDEVTRKRALKTLKQIGG